MYNTIVEDGIVIASARHSYMNHGKCMGVHTVSDVEAVYSIMDTSEGFSSPIIKFITIDYTDGSFSVQRQIDNFSAITWATTSYKSGHI